MLATNYEDMKSRVVYVNESFLPGCGIVMLVNDVNDLDLNKYNRRAVYDECCHVLSAAGRVLHDTSVVPLMVSAHGVDGEYGCAGP